MGFQLFVHFKGMRASLRASVQSLKSPAAGSVSRPPTCSSRPAEGHRHRGSPFTGEVVQKHPAPLSYILFYTKSQRFRVQKVKAISSRPPHGADRALNPKGGEGGLPDLLICSRTDHRGSAPFTFPLYWCLRHAQVPCQRGLAAVCWYCRVLVPLFRPWCRQDHLPQLA